jgi:hypothetical protein
MTHGHRLTEEDRRLAPLYFRLIDAERAGALLSADATCDILGIARTEPDASELCERYLERARWLVDEGWKQLIEPVGGAGILSSRDKGGCP